MTSTSRVLVDDLRHSLREVAPPRTRRRVAWHRLLTLLLAMWALAHQVIELA